MTVALKERAHEVEGRTGEEVGDKEKLETSENNHYHLIASLTANSLYSFTHVVLDSFGCFDLFATALKERIVVRTSVRHRQV